MKSRAHFKGHPLHPGLVHFPIAFLAGAFLFDLAGAMAGRPALWATGKHLAVAGVVMGVVASLPGLADLLGTVPPDSTARKRGVKHALLNVTALLLFALGLSALRPDDTTAPGGLLLLVEAAGLAAIAAGGWLGGTLVARNQIGIDHRYANAGRWREERVPVSSGTIHLKMPDLQVDQMMLLHADGRRIVLGRTAQGFVAFDDRCPHRGGSLADGVLMCGTVQCPWHGSQFDVSSGALRAGPAEEGVRTYIVKQSGETLNIDTGRTR